MEAKASIEDYSFCKLYDLDLPVGLKITRLDIPRSRQRVQASILAQIPDAFEKITQSKVSICLKTRCVSAESSLSQWEYISSQSLSTRGCVWENEWCFFDAKFADLPMNASLEIQLCASDGLTDYGVIGETFIGLFGKYGSFKGGPCKLHIKARAANRKESFKASTLLDKLLWEYKEDDQQASDIEWLNGKSFSELVKHENEALERSADVVLHLTLPSFDFPVLFLEKPFVFPPQYDFVRPDAKNVTLQDPEVYVENFSELKHRRLVRGQRRGRELLDRDLKPDSRARDELHSVLLYPPTCTMTSEETDLVWKFRFYLTRDKKALTKFLKAVDWNDDSEVRMAVEMLPLWAEIDIDDALELVGPEFSSSAVLAFGVKQLSRASDDELAHYLLQLVQALKFHQPRQFDSDPLAQLLLDRAVSSPHTIGQLLFWYFHVECEDALVQSIYAPLQRLFLEAMRSAISGKSILKMLQRQQTLIRTLADIASEAQALRIPRNKKTEWLRQRLTDAKLQLEKFAPLAFPLDPKVFVTGLAAERATIFKSSLMPFHLSFVRADGGEYSVIFKHGDDLRQDQFVLQIIILMDRLLQQESLDLKLTPYKVLATSHKHGMIQFVPSQALASILGTYSGDLQNYLRRHHPDRTGPFGIHPMVMETYIRSCAGYCVITYLLGVGDRHLDNLLLTPAGNLFHVDFGYILGRDPKHFAPPMKLCKEMVEAMGGQSSPHYAKFKSYCFSAFNILRKNANLILNLFHLMVKTSLPDIAIAPDQVVYKVQEKFRLDLTEEQAIVFFSQLITDSVSALFPQVIDRIHSWAQYWRK